MSDLSESTPLEARITAFCLRKECYDKIKNIIDADMFEGDWGAIWHVVVVAHCNYDGNVSKDELLALFDVEYPAMTDTIRERCWEKIDDLNDVTGENYELQFEIIKKLWMRHRARIISEMAVKIFLGKQNEFGELKRLIESTAEDSIGEKTSYTEVKMGLHELLDSLTLEPDFPFTWEPLAGIVPGLDRGHFGIIFARPETGKTTFCSFLAQSYLKQGLKVAVWGNEEPAIRTKLRIIQSHVKTTREELVRKRDKYAQIYREQIADNLFVLDCVGTTLQEVDDWCKINKPDVVFIDQLDKVIVTGKYNRSDEKLKEIYLQTREIAKRNKCLVWGVSQASYEAEGLRVLSYHLLDNSKTGKAGEADLILGIGKVNDEWGNEGIRTVHISKNKINGEHGSVTVRMDKDRAFYNQSNIPDDLMTEDYFNANDLSGSDRH